jgi:hypothetical protein
MPSQSWVWDHSPIKGDAVLDGATDSAADAVDSSVVDLAAGPAQPVARIKATINP